MIVRLGTRGLVPCEHNLLIWQNADASDRQWGAAIATPYQRFNSQVYGATIEAALTALMKATNREADL